MDSTSSTTQHSRSPSPSTPEPSDALDPITIQSELDLTSWYLSSMHRTKDNVSPWISDSVYTLQHKIEDDQMLRLDELIEDHAYDESPPSELKSSLSHPSLPSYSVTSSPSHHAETAIPDVRASNLLIPSRSGPVSLTKPIPPPASLLRKQDHSTINQRVIHPSKESCFNLPIMIPSIPEGGTKSRVETQIRVTIDLAESCSSSDPFKYNRVGSWKWLKLPHGTTTKKRTRKQGKIDPDPQDVLDLVTSVTCASSPRTNVLSCSSCQAREAKRVAKKLAARVRPARSDSESEGDGNGKQGKHLNGKQHEDTTNIIQFNCAEILDFSTGTVVLPLRLRCYCRHHREKVGFIVHFSMLDNLGRVVGTGMSRPIMITDDHKTSSNKPPELITNFAALDHPDWSQVGGTLSEMLPIVDLRAPSKRKKELSSTTNAKKRPKPYDSNGKPNRVSREGSVTSQQSPPTAYSPLPTTRDSTPFSVVQNTISSDPPGSSNPPSLHHPMQGSETSSPDSLATPLDQSSDVYMPEANFSLSDTSPTLSHSLSPSNLMIQPSLPHSLSFMFFDQQGIPVQIPTIHRLIPNMGPTHGGIEVTVLGANFHPSVPLNCVFGDVTASSTQRWSDNTLVCVLPPRATPGVVAVWFEGFPKSEDQINALPSLFTYSDESDRALMELALQVVGLKMTGKIEDAKNVAMRIVGNAGGDGSDSQGGNNGNIMQLAPFSTTRDLRPLLFSRAGENDNFESLIVDFLAIIDAPLDNSAPDSISTLDAISYTSASGQTLLHFASFLGFSSLTSFLVKHGADLDIRDRNGFTPLHFAAISGSTSCASILVRAGADLAIVNVLGKTSKEIAVPGFFDDILPTEEDLESDRESSADDDGDLGDAEDDDLQFTWISRRRISRRTSRLNVLRSGKSTPRLSANVSRAATPPLDDKASKGDAPIKENTDAADAKRAASFMEKMIQRTLAQFPAPQGIIPQLPLPHLPHLPDLPAVPWGAFPQIPLVFPVFVPMIPGWPSFFGGDHAAAVNTDRPEGDDTTANTGKVALRAAQEWRATWEKWVALVIATTPPQQTEDLPPPVYTPRAAESGSAPVSQETLPQVVEVLASTSTRPHPSEIRPLGYDRAPVPEQVIESFGATKPTQKLEKKHDRMLLLFWLPILLLSMLWAFHNGVRFALHAIKLALPARTPLRH